MFGSVPFSSFSTGKKSGLFYGLLRLDILMIFMSNSLHGPTAGHKLVLERFTEQIFFDLTVARPQTVSIVLARLGTFVATVQSGSRILLLLLRFASSNPGSGCGRLPMKSRTF